MMNAYLFQRPHDDTVIDFTELRRPILRSPFWLASIG